MLTDEYRYKLLRILESNPQASQRELARALGVSVGKVNHCLNALIEKGWLKARNFKNSKNKRAYMYYLTPRGIDAKKARRIQTANARLNAAFVRMSAAYVSTRPSSKNWR